MSKKTGSTSKHDNFANTSEKILKKKIAFLQKELRFAAVKLEKSEKTLHALRGFFSGIPYGINVTSEDYTILYANEAGIALLGAPAPEGRQYHSLFKMNKIPPDTSIMDEALSSGKEQQGIAMLPNGLFSECLSKPIALSDGRKAVINMYLDTGNQADAESPIPPIARAAGKSRDGVIITDAEGNIIFVNDPLLRLTGFKRLELIHSHLAIILPRDLTLLQVSNFISTIRSCPRWESELKTETKNRRIINVLFSASPIRDTQGNISGLVCVLKDISAKKTMEKTIEQERKKLSSLISSIRADICQINRDFRITWANGSFECRFGGLNKIKGRKISDVVNPAEQFADWQTARAIFDKAATEISEWDHDNNNYTATYLPVFDESGRVKEVLIVSLNVTDDKLAQTKAQKRKKELTALLEISRAADRAFCIEDLAPKIFGTIHGLFDNDLDLSYTASDDSLDLELTEFFAAEEKGCRPPLLLKHTETARLSRCVFDRDFCILRSLDDCGNLPSQLKAYLDEFGIASTVIIPVKSPKTRFGLMIIACSKHQLCAEDEIFWKSLARQISVSADRIHLLSTRQKQVEILKELHQIGCAVTSKHDIGSMLTHICHFLLEVMGFCAFSADISVPEKFEYKCMSSEDRQCKKVREIKIDPGLKSDLKQAASRAEDTTEFQIIDRGDMIFRGVSSAPVGGESYGAAGVFPIADGDSVYGTITLFGRSGDQFNEESISALQTMFHQTAVAIENIKLISGLKKTMKEISEKEKFLSTVINNSADGILVSDGDGNVITANKPFYDLLGALPGESISLKEILIPNLDTSADYDFSNLFSYLTMDNNITNQERRLRRKNGSFIPVELSLRTYKDDDNTPGGIILTARDIRDKLALQDQLFQTEKLSTLGEVISSVAHELNNPLTGVIGFSELLADNKNLDEKTNEILNKILHEADRCRKIVSNLLWFSRKHPVEKTRTNINSLVDEILELKEYEMKVTNINVDKNLSPDIPITSGNPHLLQQVFFNIINNAHQAMISQDSGGTLRITTSRQGNAIVADFSDTGPGIDPDIMPRIFDSFFTTKMPHKGTGLGLSLSKEIIENHGGSISAKSEPGKGSAFTVTIPIVSPEAVKNKDAVVLNPPASVEPGRILIVDDEESILDLLREVLENKKHVIDAASDADEALEKMATRDYDCIISDIRMPGMDGNELYEHLSEIKDDVRDKIVFITGDVLNEETDRFISGTNIRCLEKPFTADEILAVVNCVLAKKADAACE